MSKPKTGIRIEVFRTGTFKPMAGKEISFGADDLAAIATGYDPDNSPAPIVIGHPSTDAPAYGWVSGFEYDEDADRLFADVDELQPDFAEAVSEGRYKKVSMSFHTPDAPNNPSPGQWYAKHLGFLGAAAPAVPGLKPVQFAECAEGEEVVFEAAFGDAAFEDTASLFRNMRDFFIEKFGLEAADKVLPSYRIEWLGDYTVPKTTDALDDALPSFSSGDPSPGSDPSPQTEEPTMTPEEIAAKEAELQAREDAVSARETADRQKAHAAFADGLVDAGKLLPANKDKFVTIMNALPADAEVSFAEGSEEPLAQALMALMEGQPKAVNFGEEDLGDEPGDISENAEQIASFAAAYQKEQADLGIHVSTSEAVVHVLKEKGASK